MLTLVENGFLLVQDLNQLNYYDRHCRKAIHYAAYGKNSRIVDIIFLTTRLYYEGIKAFELAKLKGVEPLEFFFFDNFDRKGKNACSN